MARVDTAVSILEPPLTDILDPDSLQRNYGMLRRRLDSFSTSQRLLVQRFARMAPPLEEP